MKHVEENVTKRDHTIKTTKNLYQLTAEIIIVVGWQPIQTTMEIVQRTKVLLEVISYEDMID